MQAKESLNGLLHFYCGEIGAPKWDNKVVFCDGIEHFINCIQIYNVDQKPSNQIIYNSKTGKVSTYTINGKTHFGEIDVVDLILDWISKP